MRKRLLSAALAAAVLLPPSWAGASTVDLFSSLLVFGDSLSDNGNLYAATGGAVPPDPPYYEGRSSNGPVWADHIADDFAAKGLHHRNYAYAHGRAVGGDDTGRPPQALDLDEQIDEFAADPGRLGSRPLATILIGSNDIIRALTTDPANLPAASIAAANAVADGIDRLSALGVKNYLVFTLPPIGKGPAFLGTPGEVFADGAADLYNATLEARLSQVPGRRTFDLHAGLLDAIADPAKYGFSNVTQSCLGPGGVICADPDAYLFFDGLHPTAAAHAQIADQVRAQVAPVPLPLPAALMLVGIAALVVARRRGQV